MTESEICYSSSGKTLVEFLNDHDLARYVSPYHSFYGNSIRHRFFKRFEKVGDGLRLVAHVSTTIADFYDSEYKMSFKGREILIDTVPYSEVELLAEGSSSVDDLRDELIKVFQKDGSPWMLELLWTFETDRSFRVSDAHALAEISQEIFALLLMGNSAGSKDSVYSQVKDVFENASLSPVLSVYMKSVAQMMLDSGFSHVSKNAVGFNFYRVMLNLAHSCVVESTSVDFMLYCVKLFPGDLVNSMIELFVYATVLSAGELQSHC